MLILPVQPSKANALQEPNSHVAPTRPGRTACGHTGAELSGCGSAQVTFRHPDHVARGDETIPSAPCTHAKVLLPGAGLNEPI